MRQFRTDIIIFLGLLIIGLLVLVLAAGQSTIDIQFHDTYFVLDKISMTALLIGPLTFLIFLARGLTRRFKTKGANIGLIIGLMLVGLITYQVIQLQQSYLSEMIKFDYEGLHEKGQFIADAKMRINWAWGLFSLWIMGLFLLTFRTIKIWKEEFNNQL